VMLLKEMSRDKRDEGEALNSSCGRSLRAPPGYAYFRRIYTTSSIVHRPLGGAPGGMPPKAWSYVFRSLGHKESGIGTEWGEGGLKSYCNS
jgi:hypothetical protein